MSHFYPQRRPSHIHFYPPTYTANATIHRVARLPEKPSIFAVPYDRIVQKQASI